MRTGSSRPHIKVGLGLPAWGGDCVCWRRKLDYAAPQLHAAGYNGRSQPVHGYRQTDDDPASSPFGPATLRLTTAVGYEVDVGDFAAVKAATEACHPLVQVTEMTGDAAGLRAVAEEARVGRLGHGGALLRHAVEARRVAP